MRHEGMGIGTGRRPTESGVSDGRRPLLPAAQRYPGHASYLVMACSKWDEMKCLGLTDLRERLWKHLAVPIKGAVGSRRSPWVPAAVRVSSHLLVWAALIVPMVVVLASGWVPVGDVAAIAIHAHQSLSLHPPLVGMFSTLARSSGRFVYDPGPLLFWLLAIPVRIDPVRGAMWGAVVLGGTALSVAIEAVWSARQWLGCAVVAFAIVDYLWFVPPVVENLAWNAFFPVPFLIAATAVAWVVATGKLGWWPVLVFLGSVAAQGQLIYTLPALALIVSAPVVALVVAGRPKRLRWLATGSVVALACWLAPFGQQLGSRGNLSVLAGSGQGLPRTGFTFGLRAVGAIGSPSALWLHRLPGSYVTVLESIVVNPAALGVVVLGGLGLVASAAWWSGQRPLCALSLVALASSVGLMIGFAEVPLENSLSLDYMICVLWAASVLVWAVAVWAVLSFIAAVAGARRSAGARTDPRRRRHERWETAAGLAAVSVPAAALVVGAIALHSFVPTEGTVGGSSGDFRSVVQLTSRIERSVPPGAIVLSVSAQGPDLLEKVTVEEGVAWRLESDGWRPGLDSDPYTGLRPLRGAPTFEFATSRGGQVVIARP
jgi:hypothetical protein